MDLSVRYEHKVGALNQADGTVHLPRSSRLGCQVTGHGQGRFYEQAANGNMFSLVLAAWTSTIAAGNQNGAAAAASTQFAVWNPIGSGKNLSLVKFSTWPISGTAPVPCVFHSKSVTCPTIANAAVTPLQSNNTGKAASSVAGYLASAAGANLTGSSILQIIRAADLCITAGTAANLQGLRTVEYIDGDIVIAPGTAWVPTWVAAGTTYLGGYSVTWEEIPI